MGKTCNWRYARSSGLACIPVSYRDGGFKWARWTGRIKEGWAIQARFLRHQARIDMHREVHSRHWGWKSDWD